MEKAREKVSDGLGTVTRRNVESRLGHIVFATPRFKGASPAPKTPFSIVKHAGVSDVPLNDDEAERRQRRMENHFKNVMSPGCHTPRSAAGFPDKSGDSGTSSFTNAEITEHYAVCLKLSAENKISSKNAFGLHLIDWMTELLRKRGEMTNFQVAGCTLDASAKIYAARVDSIYNDALKMLGGFGRSDSPTGEEDREDDSQEPQGKGRKKGKRNIGSTFQTIAKDPKSLNVNTFDLEFEVDPLFKKISSTIDKEGVDGLLLNQLTVGSDKCDLVFDSSYVPAVKDTPLLTTPSQEDCLSEIRDMLQHVCIRDTKICPSFSNFKFNMTMKEYNDWLTSFDSEAPPTTDGHHPHMSTDYTMLPVPSQSVTDSQVPSTNTSLYGDDVGEEPPIMGSDDVFDAPEPSSSPMSTDRQVLTVIDTNTGSNSQNVLLSGSTCLVDNIEISEYSYFKPQVLNAWAGPQHWKFRPHSRQGECSTEGQSKTIDKTVKRQKKASRQSYRVDFTVSVKHELFKKGKRSTTISQAMIEKLNPAKTTLPHDPHTDIALLYKMFTRPLWMIKRKNVTLSDHDSENEEICDYDYNNPTDNAGHQYDYNDVDEPLEAMNDDTDLESVRIGGDQFMNMLSDPPQSESIADNLVTEPKRVNPIQIDYAKRAKRVDVKKVKSIMWNAISKQNNDLSLSPSKETHSLSLTTLHSDVINTLSSAIAKEMSVPVSFVCLLHLANEKVLSITDSKDLSDLQISLTEDSPGG